MSSSPLREVLADSARGGAEDQIQTEEDREDISAETGRRKERKGVPGRGEQPEQRPRGRSVPGVFGQQGGDSCG